MQQHEAGRGLEEAGLLQFLHGLHEGGLRFGDIADQETFGAEALEASGNRALIGGRVADVELILADADIERGQGCGATVM